MALGTSVPRPNHGGHNWKMRCIIGLALQCVNLKQYPTLMGININALLLPQNANPSTNSQVGHSECEETLMLFSIVLVDRAYGND